MIIRSSNLVLATALAGSFALAGCASEPYGTNQGYGTPSGSYPTARCQTCGVVQDVSQVYVPSNDRSTLGAVIGAVAGGVLGHQVGGGKGKQAATVAGAVAGGVVGHEVGKRSSSGDIPAWRISVRLDNGQYATVTQKEDPRVRVGDYVEVRGDHVYVR